jgi:hypothetical protein
MIVTSYGILLVLVVVPVGHRNSSKFAATVRIAVEVLLDIMVESDERGSMAASEAHDSRALITRVFGIELLLDVRRDRRRIEWLSVVVPKSVQLIDDLGGKRHPRRR